METFSDLLAEDLHIPQLIADEVTNIWRKENNLSYREKDGIIVPSKIYVSKRLDEATIALMIKHYTKKRTLRYINICYINVGILTLIQENSTCNNIINNARLIEKEIQKQLI